ncbi:AI-2E family transporter [Flavobacterium noncentrifugens]|uniref:Predicted PurR-regulated permease PerM n=1 Tax=Flavobacterium noncentrifugens TaxID=1128970 RepID=A0A1G8YL50_9FLAO|nr:AI-2E family transporter [Flavobacterium noncentrifugens]GEP51264.1 AI-2E family transporter [Flavobacterium noncentrifugens]SDK03397.1 Predicted PurR-regulated permease PerM [Flavobacterium noncentrifugens]
MVQTTPFYTRLAHILVGMICLFYIAIIGQTILAPLLFALLFSLLLLPVANFLEQRFKFSRSISSIVVLLGLIVIISGLVSLLLSQLSALTQDIPAFKQQLLVASKEIQDWISRTFHINNTQQLSYIDSAATDALSTGTTLLGHTLLSVSSLMLFLVFTFLYTFFMLLHRKLLLRFIISLFRDEHTIIVYDAVNQIRYIVKKYIVGLFTQMLIVTILACAAFEIIGIKYAFLLGLITGIFNVIPYIGIFTALLLSTLITFATMGTTDVLFVLMSVIAIHLVDSNYIMPKIVGSKVKINPLAALLGLVIGEMVWGISGMFLSIPVIAIFKVIFDRVDGMKPWGMVLGDEDNPPVVPAAETIPKPEFVQKEKP